MKNRIVTSAILCVLFCNGCMNHISDEPEEPDESGSKTIVFKADLSVTQAPVRNVSDNISHLIMADYQNNVRKQLVKQISSEAGFGSISIPLEYGEHELIFVGHNSENSVFEYPIMSFDKPTDSFSYYVKLNVDDNTPTTQTISLDRCVGLIKIVAKDAIPPTVSYLKVKLSKYYHSLNIKTSLADGVSESIERSFEYKTSHIGSKGSTYSIYTFTPANGFTTDISISSIDAKGQVTHSIEMKDISVEKNKQTILSGNIFQVGTETEVTVNNQWNTSIEIPIRKTN